MRISLLDLQPGTNYQFQVRAVNATTVSEFSRIFSLTTVSDGTTPNAPTSFTWTTIGTSFVASWTKPTQNTDGSALNDFDHFELVLTAGGVDKTISTTNTTYTLSISENIALWGTAKSSITAKVKAVDNIGNSSAFAGPTTTSNAVPNNPTAVTAVAIVNGIALSWTPPADDDITGYNVYLSAAKVGSTTGTSFTYNTTTYTPTTLTVKAVDVYGQESTGANANTVTPTSPFGADTTAPAVPTGLASVITTASTADLATIATVTWTANAESDLAGYVIRYRKVGDTNYTEEQVSKDVNNYVVRNLQPYVNYEFQIRAFDWQANYSAFSSTVTATGATNAAPSTPTAPTVAANTMQIQVTVPGTKASGGAMESDVNFYEIYGSTTTGFTPAAANQLGIIPVGPAMVQTFQIPTGGSASTQTWFVKIIAVDSGGLKSSASAQTSSTPSLIQATNITDATITNAKISDLAADKITAGTGLINSLTVKSTLTLGDASTNGIIQSFGYSSPTTGFKIDKTTFEVNQGTIRAAALVLQQGENLIPPQYADFETTNIVVIPSIAMTIVPDTVDFKFNSQSLKWSSLASSSITLATSTTDYNIAVADTASTTTDYIVSYYAMIKTGATTSNLQPFMNYKTSGAPGQITGTNQAIPANSTWTRYSTVVTLPATTPKGGANLGFQASASTTIYIDGVQVEPRWGQPTTPSSWTPGTTTRIDGGLIRTGSIRSTTVTQVWDSTTNTYIDDPGGAPVWIIDTQGDATFGSVNVTGSLVVGTSTDSPTRLSTMASFNYVPNLTGWMIRSDGYAEFQQMAANSIQVDALATGSLTASMELSTGSQGRIVANGTDGAKVVMEASGFSVYGQKGIAPEAPVLVRFPTTGDPNIISGVLEANTLTVNTGGTFRGTSAIEQASSLIVEGWVTDPKSAPTIGATWVTTAFDFAAMRTSLGINANATPNIFAACRFGTKIAALREMIPGVDGYAGSNVYKLVVFNTNGTFDSASTITGITPGFGNPVSMMYNSTWGKFYFCMLKQTGNIVGGHIVWSYSNELYSVNSTTFAATLQQTYSGDMVQSVGIDYLTTTRVLRYVPAEFGVNSQVFAMNVDGSGNRTSDSAALVTLAGTSGYNYPAAYVARGNFDYGAERWVVKMTNSSASTSNRTFHAWNSTGTNQVNSEWISSGTSGTSGGNWDTGASKFEEYTLNLGMTVYDGGELLMSGGAETWNVAYTWYDGTTVVPSQKSLTTNVATITTATQHGYSTGDQVTVALSPADATFDGTFTITGTPTTTSFTYAKVAANVTTAATSGSVTANRTFNISNKALTSNVATLTTSATHNLVIGDPIIVAGVDATFNGYYVVASTPTTTTFTYAKTAANVTSVAATGTVRSGFHETLLSTAYANPMTRRARMSVTIPNIPIGSQSGTSPDSAKIYVFKTGDTVYRPRVTIAYPNKSTVIDPAVSVGDPPPIANTFPKVNPGQIISSTGNSFWKGDDTAQFYQLVVNSNTDVSSSGGNMPALRVGNIAGGHLRIDGNEIMAMTSDTVQGNLLLNSGGLTALGGGMYIRSTYYGIETGRTTNASSIVTVSHNIGVAGANYSVSIGPRSAHQFMVQNKQTTSFDVVCRTAAGALTGTGVSVNFDWWIVGHTNAL